MTDKYEIEIAKQESIRNEMIENGAHFCYKCEKRIQFEQKCLFNNEIYKSRNELGETYFQKGMSILEIDNIVTKEFPCNW
jgi:hypothetical protein